MNNICNLFLYLRMIINSMIKGTDKIGKNSLSKYKPVDQFLRIQYCIIIRIQAPFLQLDGEFPKGKTRIILQGL